jgi:hypothetical protein
MHQEGIILPKNPNTFGVFAHCPICGQLGILVYAFRSCLLFPQSRRVSRWSNPQPLRGGEHYGQNPILFVSRPVVSQTVVSVYC